MIRFEDIPDCGVLRELLEEEDMPEAGKMTEDGRKIVRFRPIEVSRLMKLCMEKVEVDPKLMFRRHSRRIFLMWMVETE